MTRHSYDSSRGRHGSGAPARPSANRPAPAPTRKQGCRGRSRLILIAVMVALVCIIAAGFMRCGSESEDPLAMLEPSSSMQYDWNNLQTINGRYSYYSNGMRSSHFGIDVSDSQGYIDWNAVAGDHVDFAIIRCGYRGITSGEVYPDEYFTYNIDSARAAGIDVGVYFYSQATTEEEAIEEAKMCLNMIGNRTLQYPIAYDFEKSSAGTGRADDIDAKQATANARAFIKTIEAAGYKTMIYGNQYDLYGYESSLLDKSVIWYAEYGTTAPTSDHKFSFWQYSNNGKIAGIDTAVDTNIDLSRVY